MRVLMLTRLVDKEDSRVGFAHEWVRALAARVDHLDVVCQEVGAHDLPSNVEVASAGKERGASRVRQLLAFQRLIRPRIRHADIVFGHMIPRYTLVAAPAAIANRVPIVHWYTHGHVDVEMRLVHALARRVVTASPESFRLRSDKTVVVGHGIDFDRFSPQGDSHRGRVILSVGRLAPVKDIETLVDAAASLYERPGFEDARFVVVGDETPQSRGYRAALEHRIAAKGLADRFELVGAIPHSEVVRYYHAARVMVSLSRTGSLDKAVLEAMGCGLPVLATGRVYAPLLADEGDRLLAREGDAHDLAAKLADLLACSPQELDALGRKLRERVVAQHSLERLMDKLVAVFQEVVR